MAARRKMILIADNDARVAPVLALHLRNEYYAVKGVADAGQALEHLASPSPPDLVIVSASLPGAGEVDIDVCRRQCEQVEIPVIWLADERRSRRMQRFLEELEAGAPVLRKPVVTADLLELVSSMLRRRVAAA
jgi:DNA-binding response OmpR family regulator